MNQVLFVVLIVIGITLVLNIIFSITKNHRMTTQIKSLWDRQLPLENFIRANHWYDNQYQTYKHRYNEDELIDDKTWSDLNLDTVFQYMNYNFTAIGEMRLYATLRKMHTVEHQHLIASFKEHRGFREKVSLILAKLGKAIYPIFPDQLSVRSSNPLFLIATYIPIVGAVIAIFAHQIGLIIVIVSVLFNIVLSILLRRTYIDDLNSLFYTSNVIISAKKLSDLEGAPEINVNFNHFIFARYFSHLLGRVSSNDEAGAFNIAFKAVFNLDYQLFHLIQHSIKNYEDEVMACYDYVAEIDNHYAVALWQETLPTYCHPEVHEQKAIQFEGLTHPLIEDAVPNDLTIDQHILLTGSNASGKSTFMKSVALNLLLAQTVYTATATSFNYKPGVIYTSMANADDVLTGDSYFMAEIKSIKRLFHLSTSQPIYCFIDEIFKGTNTTERIAASEAVLKYLDANPSYFVLAATHDIELASLLAQKYDNYHFNETILDDEIHFDYLIKPGKADTRNAIELLRITDFPMTIYENAKALAESQDQSKTSSN
ncbi:MutS-related protein [Staphylococcus auricularis]|uniref:MutS-related protein n=1 Tax=Staphylococcus auricularis TaxID=29379 RepID=UPI00193421B0|nr:MutS family DNA mismatch repair protein [Staphylococcus auricularis]MBM0868900.1 MutS family DNA mismatch repair protein [Staphylococcus auricularis]